MAAESYDITAAGRRREEVLFEGNGPLLSVLEAKEMLGFKTQFRADLVKSVPILDKQDSIQNHLLWANGKVNKILDPGNIF